MSETNVALVRQYLDKLMAQDVEGCAAMFADNATIKARDKEFQGKESILAFHQERVTGNMKILEIEKVEADGGETRADVSMTSDRLAGKRMDKLPAALHFQIEDGKITFLQLKLRLAAGLLGMLKF